MTVDEAINSAFDWSRGLINYDGVGWRTALAVLAAEVLRLREDAIPLDYVERLERDNASLQQQSDRGANTAMKLKIAVEHMAKWKKRAETADAEVDRLREALSKVADYEHIDGYLRCKCGKCVACFARIALKEQP